MKIIAIANQKGGVGKTETTKSLGIGLANKGKKVLIVDMDAQGSLTASLGYKEPDEMNDTLADIFKKKMMNEPIETGYGIIHHPEGIDLIPGNIDLSVVAVSLVNVMSREMILKNYLQTIRDDYDYVLLDCMPSLGMLTINAFTACDTVLIPTHASYLLIKGLVQLFSTVNQVKANLNSDIEIEGLLFTMVDERTNFAKEIQKSVAEQYGPYIKIFNTKIPFSVRAAEATVSGTSIYKYDPKGKVANAYRELVEEVF